MINLEMAAIAERAVNDARRKYLGFLPVRELTGDAGLGAVIAALR